MLWPAGELERGGVFGIGRRAQLCCILLEVIMRWHWIFLPVLLVSLGLWVLLWLAWLQGRSGIEIIIFKSWNEFWVWRKKKTEKKR